MRRQLNCADSRIIRDFKDIILGELAPDGKTADDWARCVCGEAADRVGRNKTAPPAPKTVPVFPAFFAKDPDGSRQRASDWFKQYLPVSRKQADKLAACAYKDKK